MITAAHGNFICNECAVIHQNEQFILLRFDHVGNSQRRLVIYLSLHLTNWVASPTSRQSYGDLSPKRIKARIVRTILGCNWRKLALGN